MTKIPIELAARYGREAVEICASGSYLSPSGSRVSVEPLLSTAKAGTVTYPPDRTVDDVHTGPLQTSVAVENQTSLAAARSLMDEGYRPAVLNFASPKSPGGGFLFGACAQEEYLARSSGLYACLVGNEMYDDLGVRLDDMYSDWVVYSPDVPVFRDDAGNLLESPYNVSFITSPAPLAGSLRRDSPERLSEIPTAFFQRILKVFSVGLLHDHDSLVLGAWGCGAFENDATMVAGLFRKAISENFAGAYAKLVFAILDRSPEERVIAPFRAALTNSRFRLSRTGIE
ncbi:MAG TPA: TIGR02452 family protein [Thermoanaerobaculia bacterium]|nr:TIGR02452 family protein [Thermoanaerobaculia bacterium]